MSTREPRGALRRAVRLLDVDLRRVALATLLGTLALGCAVALAAVSAWLIARASQMPPVLQLSVATVAVRAFGIGRGVLRYLERLVSHDVALRGMTNVRTTLYERLAAGRTAALAGVRRGDLLARVGADVDTVGDVVVRGLLPAAVAVCLGVGTVVAMCAFWVPAGLALAGCLLLAGVVAPALAARASRTTEQRAADARADLSATALGLLDDAGPLAVAGRAATERAALTAAHARVTVAADAGARPAAVAAAVGQLAVGLAVLAALVTGVPAVGAGLLAPVELAVVVLTPLAAFEATSLLPSAAIQVQRSRAAAARILALLDDADVHARPGEPAGSAGAAPTPDAGTADPVLRADGVTCAWPDGRDVLRRLDLTLRRGRSVAVAGPSGTGKTTTLLTLAGLLPPRAGGVTLDGVDLDTLARDEVAAAVVAVTEDAHVFGTTVLENLRVARGDVTPAEARATLDRVGLGPWLAGLPDGLDTLVGPDARTVSGGERRRLLLARALLAPAPLLLVDEPAEHLDAATADRLVGTLLDEARTGRRGVLLITHRVSALAGADEVLWLEDGEVAARGSHDDLLARVPGYRVALDSEQGDAGEGDGARSRVGQVGGATHG
ncbi:thiol reductant ABC exporter subunit CydC [Cellulomonas fimi]|uniref:thiol reductant ABC exporter subunit CydC n=1 Tax=Cellulomonas fimi TaxID=1708 RepID=UPI00234D15C9|nr:thiol reductant ABC exporter subunit CydC [Cellulomonas fimi]MDC7121171.1 thiol reductant ABC exporter subunit CydC [Cellulomonas fimi]